MGKNAVVIVAAGRGERLGSHGGPKQYRKLGGSSVLWHTIAGFLDHPAIDIVQVVIHPDDDRLYNESVKSHEKLQSPVYGGKTRQASCKAGIDALGNQTEKVLIHDAARPFVTSKVIANTFAGISSNTCALPAIPIADTVKRSDGNGRVSATVNREHLSLAQTPQGFMMHEIRHAHERAASETNEEFTDDAAIAEWAGMEILLVEGDRNNFKITNAQDLEAAEQRVTHMNALPDIRTGNGYDVHALGPGDHVVLCGVNIPHDQSLQGHSDADVGLHSLTDALLGTIGEGDIGSHFPPSDAKWRGASSDLFLRHAVSLVKDANGVITNLDVTIICEAPKIGGHREVMRSVIADICGLEVKRVSVKATTNEKIGFIGRNEGIAALATATVVFGDN